MPQTNFSGGGLQGFVLDIPADVDEADAVSKLSAHQDVMRVVPDTWVGIAVATGEQQLHEAVQNLQCTETTQYVSFEG
jgi:hypothetical protein